MKDNYEIGDNEVRVVGGDDDKGRKPRLRRIIKVIAVCVALAAIAVILAVVLLQDKDTETPGNETPDVQGTSNAPTAADSIWFCNTDNSRASEIAVSDTVIDSINLQILTPYNVSPELYVGQIDTADKNILFATQAADLAKDRGKIVGAFVLAGEPLSWGLSKKGYCAIFGDSITVGVAENSPLFEQATDVGGYFFRQYPAVSNGKMVENNPQNRSFRRALCTLDGKMCVIFSTDRVLMNDFSTALAKLGVKDGIFLVGSTAHGWYRSPDNDNVVQLGFPRAPRTKNVNYLIFRRQ